MVSRRTRDNSVLWQKAVAGGGFLKPELKTTGKW